MLVYSVEGAIGVGKTTFLNELSNYVNTNDGLHSKVLIVPEPVDEWCAGGAVEGGEEMSPLEAFYDNPEENAAIFQVYVLISRLQYLQNRLEQFRDEFDDYPNVIFVERFGGLADEEVFVRVLCDRGIIKIHQYEMYRRILLSLKAYNIPYEDLALVYITAPFNTTRVRIAQRAREAENIADVGHILRIYNRYEAWLAQEEFYNCPSNGLIPIYQIDNQRPQHYLRNSIENIFKSEVCVRHLNKNN
jgi:deoxyadenosine/deoxycytidine kinase